MELPLYLHLIIHFFWAISVGLVVGHVCGWKLGGVIGGISGGFFIDLDHVLEYFLVFGWHLNISNFIDGWQFLVSEQVHLYFHAWEYIPLLLLIAYYFRKKRALVIIVLALVSGGFVHLVSDCLINHYPLRNYSISYRARAGYAVNSILNSEQYLEYRITKGELGL